MSLSDPNAEWLEADGLGGFASGTVSGIRTRRYHALLLTATAPPSGRVVLVNGFDAWLETPQGTFALSSQSYGRDVVHPDGASRIESFDYEPWPRWRFRIGEDLVVEQEIFVPHGEAAVILSWKMVEGKSEATLWVRPEALWLNALAIGAQFSGRWEAILEQGRRSFAERFWNSDGGCLYDVIDCDHNAGTVDLSFRPNQIFAVGGSPLVLLESDRARRVVDAVEARLLTPLGLRSLAPGAPGYVGEYRGGAATRDAAYHQDTVWPWLIGPFVEAWLRVRGHSAAAKKEAANRFIMPLLEQREHAGLGHISEIADGDYPHHPAGCPFQAWSLGELLRLDDLL